MIDYQSYVRAEPERRTVTPAADAIAAFARAAGDGHAEHFAPGRETAPPTFAFALAMAGDAFAFPTDGLIHAEQAFAFARPVRAGEPLVVERALTRARQRGEGAGAMWLLTWEASALDAQGAPVFSLTSRLIARPGATNPAPRRARGPIPAADGDAAAAAPAASLRGPEVRLDRARIRAYADASGDHNPIHLDEAAARRYGLAGVVAHGMLSMAIVASLAEDWAAVGRRPLVALTARFLAPVLADERVVALGDARGDEEAALGLWSADGEEKVRANARRGPAGA